LLLHRTINLGRRGAVLGLVPLFLISSLGALWSLRIFSHLGAVEHAP